MKEFNCSNKLAKTDTKAFAFDYSLVQFWWIFIAKEADGMSSDVGLQKRVPDKLEPLRK
jgi:hypothetical protein